MKRTLTNAEITQVFLQGRHCSQCVLGQFSDLTGYDRDETDRIAACFGGGMYMGETCGAVTGGLMAIGLICEDPDRAKELAGRNITVNAVAPGFIDTEMTSVLPEAVKTKLLEEIPGGRLGEAAEVARAVSFFLQEESGYLTGQVLAVDGGMSM